MGSDNNVIDISGRLKTKPATEAKNANLIGAVVDMTERRTEEILQERRSKKRTILTEFVGAFVVVPQKGLRKVDLYDISEEGISFDVSFDDGKLDIGEEVAVRIYLSQNTYFPFVVKVTNTRHIPEEGMYRHGSQFEAEGDTAESLKHLVAFIESVSTRLQSDKGDIVVNKK